MFYRGRIWNIPEKYTLLLYQLAQRHPKKFRWIYPINTAIFTDPNNLLIHCITKIKDFEKL